MIYSGDGDGCHGWTTGVDLHSTVTATATATTIATATRLFTIIIVFYILPRLPFRKRMFNIIRTTLERKYYQY